MKLNLALPITSSIRVVYTHQGTTYGAVIANPRTHDGVIRAMLNRKVGVSQIVRLEPLSSQSPTFVTRH